jgi:hypothetical protein
MLAVAGTVPDKDFPLTEGEVRLERDHIHICGRKVRVNRGTPALLAAAIRAGEFLGLPHPFAYLVGDVGLGNGSRLLYDHLVRHVGKTDFGVITFHYLQPDVDWHNRIIFEIEEMESQPLLIADAGFMYAAKMSGFAESYELFTPDAGELAFLADEEAPHPFYTRGFILHEENQIPDLIARAYDHRNASRNLLVKGRKDHVATGEGVHATIESPMDEAMEAIGGTGDSLTGIVTALISSGMKSVQASILAARINRLAGRFACLSPASQVMDLIEHIPTAMEEVLKTEGNGYDPRQIR